MTLAYLGIPTAFFVFVACKACRYNMILYYPNGRPTMDEEEYPLECWSCHERAFHYSSPIVTEN